MAGKGGAIPGSGRKSKADEARMRDKVSPYVPKAIETVVHIMNKAEKESDRLAAAKLIIAYYAGQPPQFIESKIDGNPITVTIVENVRAD